MIINPMWFYWLQVCESLAFILQLIFGVVLGACVFIAIGFLVDEEYDTVKKVLIGIIVSVILLVGTVFIPRRQTLIAMELAKHVTYENIDLVYKEIEEKSQWLIEELKK